MPVHSDPFSCESNGKARRLRAGMRRKALLIGTSLLVYSAFPSTALAQEECGAPPPGGGSVTCPPSPNPYLNGVTYNRVADDLTVVLVPALPVNDTGRGNSTSPYADL